jgi:hypothetical protein
MAVGTAKRRLESSCVRGVIMSRFLRNVFGFAPGRLWQPILPGWFQGANFSLFQVDLGHTPNPDIEEELFEEIGTYGRQLGRLGDAVEILLKRAKLDDLSQEENDTLDDLRHQLAAVRKAKQRAGVAVRTSVAGPSRRRR